MAGGWFIAVQVLFPIPFLLLALLSLPLPSTLRTRVRRLILRFTDMVLFYKMGGAVTVYALLTSVSVVLFGITSMETYQFTQKLKLRPISDAKSDILARALKWRSERNFWISFFSVTLWLLLYRMRGLMKELDSERTRSEKDE